MIAMALIFPIPLIRRHTITNDASTTVTLLHFLSFNVLGRVHNHLSKIIVCCRVLTFDSGPESESAKFYRLQLRLRIWPKPSTPTDPNSGLDSDSAALHTRPMFFIGLLLECVKYLENKIKIYFIFAFWHSLS